jgi:hypothetical protein
MMNVYTLEAFDIMVTTLAGNELMQHISLDIPAIFTDLLFERLTVMSSVLKALEVNRNRSMMDVTTETFRHLAKLTNLRYLCIYLHLRPGGITVEELDIMATMQLRHLVIHVPKVPNSNKRVMDVWAYLKPKMPLLQTAVITYMPSDAPSEV